MIHDYNLKVHVPSQWHEGTTDYIHNTHTYIIYTCTGCTCLSTTTKTCLYNKFKLTKFYRHAIMVHYYYYFKKKICILCTHVHFVMLYFQFQSLQRFIKTKPSGLWWCAATPSVAFGIN